MWKTETSAGVFFVFIGNLELEIGNLKFLRLLSSGAEALAEAPCSIITAKLF